MTLGDYGRAAGWIAIRLLFAAVQPVGAFVAFMNFVNDVGRDFCRFHDEKKGK